MYNVRSQQDAVVVRICFKNITTTCVFEKKIDSFENHSQLVVQQKFIAGDYIAYAFSQSRGVNSSFTNIISFEHKSSKYPNKEQKIKAKQ